MQQIFDSIQPGDIVQLNCYGAQYKIKVEKKTDSAIYGLQYRVIFMGKEQDLSEGGLFPLHKISNLQVLETKEL